MPHLETRQLRKHYAALRARVAELEDESADLRLKVTELRRRIYEIQQVEKPAIARAESATPDHFRDATKMVSSAKHPDTERSVKHSRKLNGLAAWLEHEADVRKACATNEGDRWGAGRMSECAEAIREYAARKQGGAHD
jgi:phage shock protein A